jgi:hypothetical protein
MISPYPKCLIHPKQCNQPTPLTINKNSIVTFMAQLTMSHSHEFKMLF